MASEQHVGDEGTALLLAAAVGPCTCDGELGCVEDCRWCKAADPEWMCPGEAPYQYPEAVTCELRPYRFSLNRCLWPPDRDDVQCGKPVAKVFGYFCTEHEAADA